MMRPTVCVHGRVLWERESWKLTYLFERLRLSVKSGFSSSDQSSPSFSSPSARPSGRLPFTEHPGKHMHAQSEWESKGLVISLGMVEACILVHWSAGEINIRQLAEERGGRERESVTGQRGGRERERRRGWVTRRRGGVRLLVQGRGGQRCERSYV